MSSVSCFVIEHSSHQQEKKFKQKLIPKGPLFIIKLVIWLLGYANCFVDGMWQIVALESENPGVLFEFPSLL